MCGLTTRTIQNVAFGPLRVTNDMYSKSIKYFLRGCANILCADKIELFIANFSHAAPASDQSVRGAREAA